MTDLQLVGLDAELLDHATRPAQLVTVLDGASHVILDVADDDDAVRDLALEAGAAAGLVWDDRRFVLAGIRSRSSLVRLVFEDVVAAALRAQRAPLMIPAGSTTRPELVARLATEAGVAYDVDPDAELIPGVIRRADSWSTLAGLGWACFSDGDRVVVGSSEWLLGRREPLEVAAGVGEVLDVDVSMWTNKSYSAATLLVSEDWPGQPGEPVVATDLDVDPWLVASRSTVAGAETATVTLTRGPWTTTGSPTWPA